MNNKNDIRFIMAGWREFRDQSSEHPKDVQPLSEHFSFLNEAGWGGMTDVPASFAQEKEKLKTPSSKSVCELIKAIMTKVHQSNYFQQSLLAVAATLKDEGVDKFRALKKLMKTKPDVAKKYFWRMKIIPTTFDVVQKVIEAYRKGDFKKHAPDVHELIGDELNQQIFELIRNFIAREIIGHSTIGSLPMAALMILYRTIKGAACIESLNAHADRLVGTSGPFMRKLLPDLEGASKGYKVFAQQALAGSKT